MNRFTKQLPSLLSRTDVVLELRDARLPLTSINHNLESESEALVITPSAFQLGVISTVRSKNQTFYQMLNDPLTLPYLT